MPADASKPGSCRAARRLCCLVVAAVIVILVAPGAGAEPAPSAPTLRVNRVDVRRAPSVDLVVTPPRALSLLSLQAADVTVTEAGQVRPAQIARLRDADLAVAIVVNLAGSDDEVRAARGAALELIRRLPVASPMTVLGTGSSADAKAPALSTDKSAILDQLALLTQGSRPVAGAVRDAAGTVLAGGSTRPTVVVVSGAALADPLALSAAASQGPKWRKPALYLAAAGGAAIADSSTLNGGAPVTVERPSQLIGATDQITTELSSQYGVSFRSGQPAPSTVNIAVTRTGVAAQTTFTLPAAAPSGSVPAPAPERPAAGTPVPARSGGPSGVRTAAMVLIALVLLAVGAVLVIVARRREATGSPAPATAATPSAAAVAATPIAARPSAAPRPAAVSTSPAKAPSLHGTTTASARAADEGLERLGAQLANLPAGFPLDALVVRQVVGNAASAGSTLTVAGAFRDLNALPAEMNGSAWVPRWTQAMWSGFGQARGDGLSSALLARVATDVGSRNPDGGEVRPSEALVTRLGALPGSGPGPAMCAALAYQAVVSEWSDPMRGELLGRFSVVFSLASDGALRQPVLDISEHLGRRPGGTSNGNGAPPAANAGSEATPLVPVLDAISAASAQAAARLSALEGLREKWHKNAAADRDRAPEAVDAILANPIVTVVGLARRLDMSQAVAEAHIAAFETSRFLRPIGSSSHTPYWVAPAALAIVADDLGAPPRPLAHTTRS